MNLLAVHTCPVWEEDDGSLSIGIEPREDHPPVIGWCNVLKVELAGEYHLLWAVEYE